MESEYGKGRKKMIKQVMFQVENILIRVMLIGENKNKIIDFIKAYSA